MDKDQNKLIADVITLSELKDKIERFLSASQAVFKTDKSITKQLGQIFSSEDLLTINDLEKTMTANQLKDFFQKTAEVFAKVPVVNITLGCYPTLSVINKVHGWLSDRLNKTLVINVNTDETNGDQVVVEYQGKRSVLVISN